MDFPLLLKGETVGALRVEKQGLYTVMEARAPGAEGLVRLWVHGEGREAYLGVMEPDEQGLRLSRRFSRREMEAFPEKIEMASDRKLKDEVYITENTIAGEAGTGEEKDEMEVSGGAETENTENSSGASSKAREGEGGNRDGPPGEGPDKARLEPAEAARQPESKAGFPGESAPGKVTAGELIWRERRDGSLVARDEEGWLLALPARLRQTPRGARLRKICGKEYLIFRY